MQNLLNMLDKTKARIVFLTPTPHEDLGRPLPDPAEHNRQLKLYTDAIVKLAAARQAPVVNLFELLGPKLQPAAGGPLTDNGLHLTDYGYWRTAPVIEQGLGLSPRTWHIEIDPARHNIAARGVTIADVHFASGAIRFAATDEQLPLPPAPGDAPAGLPAIAEQRMVRVFDLPPGQYALSVDGQQLALASNETWRDGVAIHGGPDFEQVETTAATDTEEERTLLLSLATAERNLLVRFSQTRARTERGGDSAVRSVGRGGRGRDTPRKCPRGSALRAHARGIPMMQTRPIHRWRRLMPLTALLRRALGRHCAGTA